MANHLVIVESPGKAGTIKGYLGSNYKVVASKGHICDLPVSSLGVDIENGFKPKYINIRGKGELIQSLKKEAAKADSVFLATDPDREGEAISWHLARVLGIDSTKAKRVTFHEITRDAVKQAIARPTAIDENRVDSQQTRRILDRIVGYKLSPLLWKKIRSGLSAGRVQSVATRIVVEREQEIRNFKGEEYWTLDAILSGKAKKSFPAAFYGMNGKKITLSTGEECTKVLSDLANAQYAVKSVKRGTRTRNPAPPFTTSALQQEAYKKLNFQTQRTMRIAQELYEGVTLSKKGGQGLITYMRTDSLRISDEARNAAKAFIIDKFGNEYYPEKPRVYKAKSGAQDAHEAIRPTNLVFSPESIKANLSAEQYKVYKLIWDRFIASQMESALFDSVTAEIGAGEYVFRATGETVKFPGFLGVYEETSDDNEDKQGKNTRLPELDEGEILDLKELRHKQNFTQPPPRYSEATLIRALEEKGIGRPSTYTPTLTTILSRGYIERAGKQLVPTPLGEITTQLMSEYFSPVVDYKFTADMEEKLDNIASGNASGEEILQQFYNEFSKLLENAEASVGQGKIVVPDVELDVSCEKCGRKMVIKSGRFGKFAACPGYPACKNTKPLDKNGQIAEVSPAQIVEGMQCELCGKGVMLKKGRYGDFYACEDYPNCKFTKQVVKEAGVACPECGGKVIIKKGKKKDFYGCENYPTCTFSSWYLPTGEKCPECGDILVSKRNGTVHACRNTACKYSVKIKADITK